jgi:probable F420-dependent oxidoreductase
VAAGMLAGMRVDGGISNDLTAVPRQAQKAEEDGYDAVWSAETGHDPFLSLAIAVEHTRRLELGTGIAVAFGRNPMIVATIARDLNAYSGGRFLLGLGSQVKPHIEKRYSMPWSHPAPRMREFISAMRAIWDCWQNGTKLDFRGDFYTYTLMTPFFDPGPDEHGVPKVFRAAVGEHMTRVAGEVADGILVHGFTTERYLREVTMPTIEGALLELGRARADFQVSYPAFVVTGDTEEQLAAAAADVRKQVAFYGSTPAYRSVLELHGWGDLQTELHTLSKRGDWDEMGRRIEDEILDAFAVVGTPEEIPGLLRKRYADLVDRMSLYMPYAGEDFARRIVSGLREIS